MNLAAMHLSDPLIEIGLPVASLAFWAVAYGTTVLTTRPAAMPPGPPPGDSPVRSHRPW